MKVSLDCKHCHEPVRYDDLNVVTVKTNVIFGTKTVSSKSVLYHRYCYETK